MQQQTYFEFKPSTTAELPKRWRTYLELPRAILALVTLPLYLVHLNGAERGDGSPVLVIPGFATSDLSTLILRTYLSRLGYQVHGWDMGRNLGAKTIGLRNERLIERLDGLHRQYGQRVTLIGWSMGGIMARMISRERPEKVRQIISLGAPFAGDPYANRTWRIYERMSGHSLSHPIARAQITKSKLPPPVPSVSLYSKSDGIVAWQSCIEADQPHTKNIEVDSAHCGFGFSPAVLRTVADRLAAPLSRSVSHD